jgi:hypothetical protein
MTTELTLQIDGDTTAAIAALTTRSGKTEQEAVLTAIQEAHHAMLVADRQKEWIEQADQEALLMSQDPAERAEVAAAIRDLQGPLVLDTDEYAELYGDVCDVAERMWQHWPLNDGTDLRHTSSDARAAALRIFEILGVELA